MKNRVLFTSIILFLFLGGSLLVGVRFVSHEKVQNRNLVSLQERSIYLEEKQNVLEGMLNNEIVANNRLQGRVEYLEELVNQTVNYYEYDISYSDDTYNYLAIGNSLTFIKEWGRGICSTQPDNDYFHVVVKNLESRFGSVVAYPINFVTWERCGDERDKTLDLLDVYLDEQLDLVTIQLGENVNDLSEYESDLVNLVEYVRNKAPDVTIIIVGDFWTSEKNEMRRLAAEKSNCIFADIDLIGLVDKYQSSEGTICYLKDGNTITVTGATKSHPGDLGMKYIADKIIAALP